MLGTTIAAATTQNIQPEKIQEKIAVVETPQMTTSVPAPSIPTPTVNTPPAPIII